MVTSLTETDWEYLKALKETGVYRSGTNKRCHMDTLWHVFGEYCRLKNICHFVPRNFKARDPYSCRPYGRIYSDINRVLCLGERGRVTKFGAGLGLIMKVTNLRWEFTNGN